MFKCLFNTTSTTTPHTKIAKVTWKFRSMICCKSSIPHTTLTNPTPSPQIQVHNGTIRVVNGTSNNIRNTEESARSTSVKILTTFPMHRYPGIYGSARAGGYGGHVKAHNYKSVFSIQVASHLSGWIALRKWDCLAGEQADLRCNFGSLVCKNRQPLQRPSCESIVLVLRSFEVVVLFVIVHNWLLVFCFGICTSNRALVFSWPVPKFVPFLSYWWAHDGSQRSTIEVEHSIRFPIARERVRTYQVVFWWSLSSGCWITHFVKIGGGGVNLWAPCVASVPVRADWSWGKSWRLGCSALVVPPSWLGGTIGGKVLKVVKVDWSFSELELHWNQVCERIAFQTPSRGTS